MIEFEKRMETWKRALRGGEYRQGKSHLKKEDRYCCLGVADEVVFGATFNGITDDQGMQMSLSRSRLCDLDLNRPVSEEEVEKLSKHIREKTGDRTVVGDYPTREYFFVRMNDNHDMSFEEIADVIEMMEWDRRVA